MKKYLLMLIGLINVISIQAAGLADGHFHIIIRYSPITDAGMTYYEPVGLVDGASFNIYCGEELLYKLPLTVENEEYESGKWYGNVKVKLDDPIYLPKGNGYKFVIEADQIYNYFDESKTNERFEYTYAIPSVIEDIFPLFDVTAPVTNCQMMSVVIPTDVLIEDGSRIQFYREDVLVREEPIYTTWELLIGYAGVKFKTEIQFEENVRYSMVIPEGALKAYSRPDIANEEIVIDFYGGCPDLPAPEPKSWTIENAPDYPFPGFRISLTYDEPVALMPNSLLYIVNEDGLIIGEAVPYVETKEGNSVLTGRFLYIPQPNDQKWTLIIPEGTVVFSEGNMVVNHENRIDLSPSIVNEAITTKPKIEYDEDYIHVKGCTVGSRISLTSMDGRMMGAYDAYSEEMSIPAPPSGIYVVAIDNCKQKIHIK